MLLATIGPVALDLVVGQGVGMGRDGSLCQCQRQGTVGSVGSGRMPASGEGESGRTNAKTTNGIAPAGRQTDVALGMA